MKLDIQRFGGRGATSSTSLKKSKNRELQRIRKNKIEYAIKTHNYNYLPEDITDKELEMVRKKVK